MLLHLAPWCMGLKSSKRTHFRVWCVCWSGEGRVLVWGWGANEPCWEVPAIYIPSIAYQKKFKSFILVFQTSKSAHLYSFLSPPCLALSVFSHRTSCCFSQITILCSCYSLLLDTFGPDSLPHLQFDDPCPLFKTSLKYLVIQRSSLSLVLSGLGTTFLCPWNTPCISLLSYLLDCITVHSWYVLGLTRAWILWGCVLFYSYLNLLY